LQDGQGKLARQGNSLTLSPAPSLAGVLVSGWITVKLHLLGEIRGPSCPPNPFETGDDTKMLPAGKSPVLSPATRTGTRPGPCTWRLVTDLASTQAAPAPVFSPILVQPEHHKALPLANWLPRMAVTQDRQTIPGTGHGTCWPGQRQ
jgi:hypothetical protein